MKNLKDMKRVVRALAAFVMTMAVIQVFYAFFLIYSVRSVVSAVRQLRPGISSQAEVDTFAKRFRLFADRENGCHDYGCDYAFVIWNPLLSIPKITPRAVFMVFLDTRKGVLNQVDMGIFRAESRWRLGDRVVRVFDGSYPIPGQPSYRVTGPGYDPWLAIWLNNAASSAERDRAYAFTAKCIALPYGCERPCDYHTEAWKDAKEFAVPPNPFASNRRGTFRLAACR